MSFSDLPFQDPAGLSAQANAYFATALERSAAAMALVDHRADIAYGSDYWQKVDVFMPSGPVEGLPVVLFLHGGGWTYGYKEHCNFMAPAITALPAIFVSVNYRLAPTARFPMQLEDVVAALGWAHRHIADFGGSPDRIFIGGHSAGGHLATMATLQTDRLVAAGLPADLVKGCLPVSASFAFSVGQLEGEGKYLLARPEDAPLASPLNYIDAPGAPFHMIWADDDFKRVLDSSQAALARFQERGWSVTSLEMPGANHFSAHLDLLEPQTKWLDALRTMIAA